MPDGLGETVARPILCDNLLYLIVFGPGTGESVVLRIPDDPRPVWCVIDSCSVARANPACRILDEYDAGLSLLVLSHPHDDHANRFVELLPHLTDGAKVGAAWPRLPDESWAASLEARKHHVKGSAEDAVAGILHEWESGPKLRWEMARGQSERIGSCRVQVLNPDTTAYTNGFPANVNRLSTALLIEWRDCRLLLGGDVEIADWIAIQDVGCPTKHHGCKVPHHGSKGAQQSSWLQGIGPRAWCLTPWKKGQLPWGTGGDVSALLAANRPIHLTSAAGMANSMADAKVEKHGAATAVTETVVLHDMVLEMADQPDDEWANYVALGFDAAGSVVDTQFGTGSVSLS